MLGGIDEEHVIRFFTFFEHKNAYGNARGIKKIGGQADNGVYVAVFKQFAADAFLRTATEQYAMRQDNGHSPFPLQVVEAVQQKGEVCGGFRSQPIIFETHIFAQRLSGIPAVAERGIGHHGIEIGLFRRIGFAQHVPVVGQSVAVEYLKFRVLHTMQQHVHARQVIGGDVLFLTVDFAYALRAHAPPYIEQKRTGTAGEIKHAGKMLFGACAGILAVQRHYP